MTADYLLKQVKMMGAVVLIDGERVKVRAPIPLPETLIHGLRTYKAEILLLLTRNANFESASEWYEERAAIMEMEGGWSRTDAEREAAKLARRHFRLSESYTLH